MRCRQRVDEPQPTCLALARDQVVHQRDDEQRRQVHQHEREIEASGRGQLRVDRFRFVQLRVQSQQPHAQRIRLHVALADRRKRQRCGWIDGQVRCRIGSVPRLAAIAVLFRHGGHVVALHGRDPRQRVALGRHGVQATPYRQRRQEQQQDQRAGRQPRMQRQAQFKL